ncbi:MAG: hypothetical protein IKU62_06310 [Ruminiclostridium sp.]|nr:hypothetical protein [Ruminiclostridium sp.]
MNGNDIFLALEHIGDDLVEQAEFEAFPAQWRRLRPLLTAALIAVLLLAGLVGSAVAYGHGWFSGFFRESTGQSLTQGQMAYLQQSEHILGQAQTHDGWTIELRSALNDGTTAYIILGVTAPEGTSLETRMEENERLDILGPGNENMADVLTCTRGVDWDSLHMDWVEDGDGLEHTKNYVIQIDPVKTGGLVDPFGPKAVYHIRIENIQLQSRDTDYYQHLLDTKYQGQDGIMLTPEEAERLWITTIPARGVWEFDLTLNGDTSKREILNKPITTQASVYQREKGGIYEVVDVTLTSVILRPLSVTLSSEGVEYPQFATSDNQVFAVRKDGSRIQLLPYGTQMRRYQELKAESPLIFEELDHILLADGTMIPVS